MCNKANGELTSKVLIGSMSSLFQGKTRGEIMMDMLEEYRKSGRAFVIVTDVGCSSHKLQDQFNTDWAAAR